MKNDIDQCTLDLANPDNALPFEMQSPEPFELDAPATPWPANCLPQGLQAAVDCIADHVQSPQALAGMAVLSAVAHLSQRLVDVERVTGGAMPTSLFVLSLAGSGERKSECFRLATQPIIQAEIKARELHRDQLEQAKKAIASAKGKNAKTEAAQQNSVDPDPRTLFSDTTMEGIAKAFINDSQPALTLSTDEGGQFFGGHSMQSETRANSCGMLTKLFDGGGVERNRAGIDSGSGFRSGVRFGVFLSAQPIVVRDSLNDPFMRGQGLLPRFLLSAPESAIGTRFITDETRGRKVADNPAMQRYWATVSRMNQETVLLDDGGKLTPYCYLLPTCGEAYQLWESFYNQTEANNHSQLAVTAFLSRAGELVRRVAATLACYRAFDASSLSGVYSFYKTELGEINADDMRGAIALVEYSLAEWDRQLNRSGSTLSETEKDAYELLHWLQKGGDEWLAFTRQQLAQRGLSRLRKESPRRNAAIAELLKRRLLRDDGKRLILVELVATATSATFATSSKSDQVIEALEVAEVAEVAVAIHATENAKPEKAAEPLAALDDAEEF
ncbi:DUF3987 domain-containing protein [Chitinibacter sp. FCG-7]|uniref:DUF3987 domain-containing protein n=1 Tax=Chitinibacter mangrovi TaxID=3153927 RepID=A0AAU7FA96_9NEIS